MARETKSEIRNPKSEEPISHRAHREHRGPWISVNSVTSVANWMGFRMSVFVFLVYGLAWLTQAGARAQETSRAADANGWAPPGLSKTAVPSPETTSKAAYVNPTTGAMVSVPPPPPAVPSNDLAPAAFQQPQPPKGAMDRRQPSEEEQGVRIQLEPPGPDRIFGRRDSERSLQERIRQDVRQQRMTPFEFPEEPILTTQRYAGRVFPPMTETVEPNYLCYKRLYFEDKNSERYGWDLGFIQPVVSAGIFFWDSATLPYRMGTELCRKYECNSGYCMPGDPVPYLLYPPIWSVTGGAAEIAAVIAIAAIFPM